MSNYWKNEYDLAHVGYFFMLSTIGGAGYWECTWLGLLSQESYQNKGNRDFQTDSTEAINDSSANLILFYDYHLSYFLPLLFTFSSHNEKGSELY